MSEHLENSVSIRSYLPSIYWQLLPSFFDAPIPIERHADCRACAMCQESSPGAPRSRNYFRLDTKCCTYHPRLPNYLVGSILTESLPGVISPIEKKLINRIGVVPFGIVAPPQYDLLYYNQLGGFGKARALLCPYFNSSIGSCGIWRHRESACLTYFCKHVNGVTGELFWQRMNTFLIFLEQLLVSFALQQLGWTPEAIEQLAIKFPERKRLSASDLDSDFDENAMTLVWKKWYGREREFYLACYDLVAGLNHASLEAFGGYFYRSQLDILVGLYERMVKGELPDRLMRNPVLRVVKLDSAHVEVVAKTEPLRMSLRVHELLFHFDGSQTNDSVRELLLCQEGFELTTDFIRKLYNFRILIPADVSSTSCFPRALPDKDRGHCSVSERVAAQPSLAPHP